MGFIALVSPMIASTENSPKFSDAQMELIRGLFSEQMKSMVIEAPTDRYLIYAFLVIAVVLIVALVAILRIASSSASKAIGESIKPYVEQLAGFQKSFEKSQQAYERMAGRFTKMTEELVKFQTVRGAEEDKFDILLRQFGDLQTRTSENINSLSTAFREHEKNSYERHIEVQKEYQNILLSLVELKMKCSEKEASKNEDLDTE